mmetsp:Transcript_35748/g.52217  ORF Transcript_35748/g.52217 Transcript_35748/m.52217 type:complete len:85 (+) Transcript_35748:1857-2111(+)
MQKKDEIPLTSSILSPITLPPIVDDERVDNVDDNKNTQNETRMSAATITTNNSVNDNEEGKKKSSDVKINMSVKDMGKKIVSLF